MNGFAVGEEKVTHHPRKYGKTKYTLWRLYKGFLDLINLVFWNKFSTRPLHLFGFLGLLQFLIGGIIGFYLIVEKFMFNVSIGSHPLLLLAVLLVILGVQFLFFGFITDMLMRIYYSDKKSYKISEILE